MKARYCRYKGGRPARGPSNLGLSTNAGGNLVFNGGTLQYTGTGASTDRLFTLTTNGGGLDASGSGPLTFSNTGSVALSGTGARTLTLTGKNTGTLGPSLADNGGSTSLVKTGAGTWILTGTNNYSGGTTIAGGTLQLGNGGTSGSITGNVTDNGTLAFNRSDLVIFSGLISGGGAVNQLGTGTTILTGTNTYSGGTVINTGTLQLGNGGATGSILGNVIDDGTLAFDRSDTVTFPGLVSGSGTLVQMGSGTTILTADNTYTGGTTISTGTLQIGAGGTTGSILGNVDNNGTLIFNHSGTANSAKRTFDGLISGTGSVVKTGPDILELTNNNTFTGKLTIQNGVLVAGIPAGSNQTTSFALGQGDVLLQAGTLRAPTLDPIVINIGRDYIQGQAGTLQLAVAGVDGKDYDRVSARGSVSVNGTLSVFSLNGFAPANGNAFEVVRGDAGRSGTFRTINDFLNLDHLQRVNIYAKNAVVLLYLKPTGPVEPPSPPVVIPPTSGETPPPEPPPITEQDPDKVVPPVEPGAPLPEPEVEQLVDSTAQELTSLYEISFSAANMQRFNLGDRMFQIQQSVVPALEPVPPLVSSAKGVEGKEVEGNALPAAPAPAPSLINRWGVWANGWGDFVNVGTTSGAQGYRFTTGGVSAGVDYLIVPNHFAVGLLGGYSHSWINFTPSGGAETDTGRGGLYATYFNRGWWVDAAVWGGGTDYSTSRQALAGTAKGSTSGWEFSTFGEAGYDIHCGALAFGPTAAMQFTRVFLNGFSENGSLVPLDIHGAGQNSLRTDVGGRVYYKWFVGNIPVIPTVNLGWEHEYKYSTLDIGASAPILDTSTTFSGPNIGHDSLLINAGISVQWTARIWTTIGYDGDVARDHYNSNAVSGTFSFTF